MMGAAIEIKEDELLAKLIASGTSLVSTKDTATVLGYEPQTLRKWASTGSGDLRPVFTKNGAKWRLTDIRNLLGV